jgi:transcriptional regulator with XRE-family HTH domain
VESPERPALFVAFGVAIKRLRARRGLTQETLAERAELNRVYLAEIETGRRNPSLFNIAKIAGALGVPLGGLFVEVDRARRPEGEPSTEGRD